ncbi:MAG: shikimate dehydrogenase [Rhodobacterales bacterium]|nr:shikimate dehydrogenase [Rhodobacterales bacterium]
MTNSTIPLAGVIGSPIAHSRSPRIHGHWLSALGLRGHYIPMDVTPDHLPDVLRALPKAGFVGANITIPHKEHVIGLVDKVTERAKRIGAANTLVFSTAGEITADNTDGYGFIQNLQSAGWIAGAGPAGVLGAGGASRAVIVALLDAGVPEILLCNRTRGRADALREEFGDRLRLFDWDDAGAMLDHCATVVNTTSLGMTGQPPLEVNLDRLHKDAVVTDIVYSPLQTPLLVAAQQMGCRTVDGLGMLLHQAVPGFEQWFGQRPEVDADVRAAALA